MGSFSSTIAVQPISLEGNGACFNYAPPGFPVTNTNAPGMPLEQIALIAGNNTINLPAGTQYVVMSPPSTSTNAKTLKGVAGDTGFPLSANLAAIIPVANGTTSIIVGSAGAETVA